MKPQVIDSAFLSEMNRDRTLERVVWTLVGVSALLFGLMVGAIVWGYFSFSA